VANWQLGRNAHSKLYVHGLGVKAISAGYLDKQKVELGQFA